MLANQIGLSTKVVSERHLYASQEKMTAGEAGAKLSKILKTKISAKAVIAAFKEHFCCEPEWHHSGFYKPAGGGRKTMGRTFFFSFDQVEALAANWPAITAAIAEASAKAEAEEARAAATMVQGFFYSWDYDYSGNYGKKRNHKVLDVYEGPESNCPRNFTACTPEQFEIAKSKVGRKYYGWDEPTASEFQVIVN